MFEKFNDTINQTSSAAPKLFTGIAGVKILAINPTDGELADIIGAEQAAKFDTSYAIQERNGQSFRSLSIWYTDKDENLRPSTVGLIISGAPKTFDSGNSQLINDRLQNCIANPDTIDDNPRMGWFKREGMRIARQGEVDYYDLMGKILRFDYKGDASLIDVLKSEGMDFDTVLNGNFDGLRKFAAYVKDNGILFNALYTVREKEDGDKTYFNQKLILRPETTFRTTTGITSDWEIEKLTKTYKDTKERGYDLTKDWFTFKFQEFNKEDCVNYEQPPEEVASQDDTETSFSWT